MLRQPQPAPANPQGKPQPNPDKALQAADKVMAEDIAGGNFRRAEARTGKLRREAPVALREDKAPGREGKDREAGTAPSNR